MLKNNALRYFTDHVEPKASNVEQAIDDMKKHFIAEANINPYTSEWNNLSLRDLKKKHEK